MREERQLAGKHAKMAGNMLEKPEAASEALKIAKKRDR
jgi:hypothetical protein